MQTTISIITLVIVVILGITATILCFKEGHRLLKKFSKLNDDYFDYTNAILSIVFGCMYIFITIIGTVLLLLYIFWLKENKNELLYYFRKKIERTYVSWT